MSRRTLLALAIASILVVPFANAADPSLQIIAYAQGNFADQPLTDRRIASLHLEQSDAPATELIGIRLFREFSPRWAIGIQADYGRSEVKRGAGTITQSSFLYDQENDIADLLLLGRRSLCTTCSRFTPFVLAGAGMAYTDGSLLAEAYPPGTDILYNYLYYETDGWFPVATLAFGLSAPLAPDARWSLECGAGYQWGALEQDVDAKGPLRFPGETIDNRVAAETIMTGPHVWIGVGRRF